VGEGLKIVVCHGLLPTGGICRLGGCYKQSYMQFSTGFWIFIFTNYQLPCSSSSCFPDKAKQVAFEQDLPVTYVLPKINSGNTCKIGSASMKIPNLAMPITHQAMVTKDDIVDFMHVHELSAYHDALESHSSYKL